MKTPIFGGFYVSRSKNFADNECVNLFPEIVESKTKAGKSVGALYLCPGLDLLASTGVNPSNTNAMHVLNGILYVVNSGVLYSISPSYTVTTLGPISVGLTTLAYVYTPAGGLSNVTLPFSPTSGDGNVYMIDNGTQLGIFVSVPAAYQDGFGLIIQPNSNLWWQSNLFNLTVWESLNFASASGDPDNLVGIIQIHREVYLLKQFDTEVWVNTGQPGFTFTRLDGVFIEAGCHTAATIRKAGETFLMLVQNKQGDSVVIQMRGYQPTRVSTFALETEISSYTTIADAFAFSYQQEGHVFYVIGFPTGNAMWAYDVTVSDAIGEPVWHRRAAFSAGAFQRHWANGYAFFNNLHVVSDYRNGNIYSFNLSTLLDNGTQRKWLRSWRALPQDINDVVQFSSLEILMQSGLNIPDGTDPQMMMEYSDDGGANWSVQRFRSMGKTGQTSKRIKFNRLGSTRRNSGLDRIFRISSTDEAPVAITDAEIE